MPSPKRWKRPKSLAQLTPNDFLVIEGRLLGRIKPRLPETSDEDCERYQAVGEKSALRLLEDLMRSYQPGDRVGYREVNKLTGYSTTHCHALIHRLKKMELWIFVPPRGRGAMPVAPQPKESQHAGSVPSS